jgi:hypothetical protein
MATSDTVTVSMMGPRQRTAFTSQWAMRDVVIIDGDDSLRGRITGFQFRDSRSNPLVAVSYVHNGAAYEVWIEEWRLSRGEER